MRTRIGIWVSAVVLVGVAGVGLALLPREEAVVMPAPPGESATDGRGRISQSAGGVTISEEGPDGVSYEISAAAWMRVKDARRATCFQFDVERTATETTITVSCDAGERVGKKSWASFEVDSTVWNGQFGEGVDSCRVRQNMKRDPVFTCTVQNPDAAAPAADDAS